MSDVRQFPEFRRRRSDGPPRGQTETAAHIDLHSRSDRGNRLSALRLHRETAAD